MSSKKGKQSTSNKRTSAGGKSIVKPKMIIRFDFPPDATPEQIAEAINKLRREHGLTGDEEERPE